MSVNSNTTANTNTKSVYPTSIKLQQHQSLCVHDKNIVSATLHHRKRWYYRFDIWLYVLIYTITFSVSLPAIIYEYHRAPDVIADDTVQLQHTGDTVGQLHSASASTHINDINTPIVTSTLKTIFDDEHINVYDQQNHSKPSSDNSDLLHSTLHTPTVTDSEHQIDPLTGLRQLTAEELASMPSAISFGAMFGIPFVIASHLALLLSTYWNMKAKSRILYYTVPLQQLSAATHIMVMPAVNSGLPAITTLLHDRTQHNIYFEYQKTKYFWHSTSGDKHNGLNGYFSAAILPLRYPLTHYLQSTGFPTVDDQMNAAQQYGENYFDIPLPEFMDLFYEHAMAPFFVFQVFCVLLWCLDEYWYYSMLTLFLLVAFEATLVKRRQKNLEDLRAMRQKPYVCYVYRSQKWQQMSTDHIYPNDIISLTASSKHLVCPADILLLTGNTVVNEALLTGESVPQIKESIEAIENYDEKLSANKLHKRSVVFAGTKVMLCNNDGNSSDQSDVGNNGVNKVSIPCPPDNGCIAYVLRTGFHTSQGELVRTILFNTDHVNVNNREAIMFIGFLLIFAIVAAAYVLYHGLQDTNRSRYKLLLNCVMIVTSVVPPELPMELSLAVNTSLLQLARQLIYCTEPFRIPVAGAIDVCAFDKTGTLTSDNFVVKGIAALNTTTRIVQNSNNTTQQPISTNAVTNNVNSVQNGVSKPTTATAATAAMPTIQARQYTDIDFKYGLTLPCDVDDYIKYVISGCHSLVSVDNQLVGDPLETAAISAIQYQVDKNGVSTGKLNNGQPAKLRILHRYAFSSALKRMSCIVALEHTTPHSLLAVVKGAAEILQDRFVDLPNNYTEILNHYSRQGCRVLALGYKILNGLHDNTADRMEVKQLPRHQIECELQFAGLLVLEVPMKSDSAATVQQLIESNHHVIMITGDNALTACSVATELLIADKPLLTLNVKHSKKQDHTTDTLLQWVSLDNKTSIPFDTSVQYESLHKLVQQYDLCLSGDSIEYLLQQHVTTQQLSLLFQCTVVYARTSPDQKELIIRCFKQHGLYTLMCGDGTNDVGALKQAHVGVALIATPETTTENQAVADSSVKPVNTMQQQIDALRAQSVAIQQNPQLSFTQKMTQQAAIIAQHKQLVQKMQAANAPPKAPPKPMNEMSKQELQAFQRQQINDLLNQMDDGSPSVVKLGDASIASPFTSKKPFVSACVDIIRQGRCTLVTTLQMFNILGINCLMSAYSMSVLYLQGVKFGDYQMTITGMSIAIFFMCLSNTKPVSRLSAQRPETQLFSVSMLISVAGQWCIHMLFMLTVISHAEVFIPPAHEHRIVEKKFTPNILNTVVFLLSNTTTVTTFVCNYRGLPFMQGLHANLNLKRALIAVFGLCMILVTDYMPELNYWLELVPMPSEEFRYTIIAAMVGDLATTYMFVRVLQNIFKPPPPQLLVSHRYRSTEHQLQIAQQQLSEDRAVAGKPAPSLKQIWQQARDEALKKQQEQQIRKNQ